MVKADLKFKGSLTVHHDIIRYSLHPVSYMPGSYMTVQTTLDKGFFIQKKQNTNSDVLNYCTK